MSTAILQQLHQEVKRLYIAGSELASGDLRLKRQLPELRKLGGKSAVFGRLADSVEGLTQPDAKGTKSAAEKQQELALLLTSVLRTMGTATPTGVLKPLTQSDAFDCAVSTTEQNTIGSAEQPITAAIAGSEDAPEQTDASASSKRNQPSAGLYSYRELAPVMTALSTSGGGRYDVVKQAYDAGLFQDIRLLESAVRAMDDSFHDIANLAAEHIVPSYGERVLPLLLPSFNPLGKRADARKIRAIAAAGGDKVNELLLQTADNGSNDVRVEAIRAMAGRDMYMDRLVEWTTDKLKPIRMAAYEALAGSQSDSALDLLMEGIVGKDHYDIATIMKRCRNAELDNRIILALQQLLQQVPERKKDTQWLTEQKYALDSYLEALWKKPIPELCDVYDDVLQHADLFKRLKWLDKLLDYASRNLAALRSNRALELLFRIEELFHPSIPYAFQTAVRLLPPDALYEHYANRITQEWESLKPARKKERVEKVFEAMSGVISEMFKAYQNGREGVLPQVNDSDIAFDEENEDRHDFSSVKFQVNMAKHWDERWLDLAIDYDKYDYIMSCLARPGHERCQEYISEMVKSKSYEKGEYSHLTLEYLFDGMNRAGMDLQLKWDTIMEMIEGAGRSARDYGFDDGLVEDHFYHLPMSYKPRIEAMLPKFKYYGKTQLEEIIEAMEKNSQSALQTNAVM
ncbi:HEAT repeat domain-containing protein [Paenibacillus sp. J5C_2022]|uniref:HEAT repeat domain-containing protein n=1 Tax=Paenibacillus sp. J5C2022 TaxID=2977129 RepID=UPI0021CED70E|nr:HEAT repeat domain-containing protein [Paenibacillus sp. J5C2022]MCU6711891.1 HEAT repeat domain-containing protein [Paenibacillus sp. J5C2022]